MDKQAMHELSGTRLEYEFARAMGFNPLGNPDGPFVLNHEKQSMVLVFGARESINISSFSMDFVDAPLNAAKDLGACLSTENGKAKCTLGEITTEGDDYGKRQRQLRRVCWQCALSCNARVSV